MHLLTCKSYTEERSSEQNLKCHFTSSQRTKCARLNFTRLKYVRSNEEVENDPFLEITYCQTVHVDSLKQTDRNVINQSKNDRTVHNRKLPYQKYTTGCAESWETYFHMNKDVFTQRIWVLLQMQSLFTFWDQGSVSVII